MSTTALVSTGRRIFPAAFSNPLAPPWRLPNFEARFVNYRWTYGGTFDIPAGSLVQNNQININGGSDFLCRELAFQINADQEPGSIRVRFKDPNGKRLSADLLTTEELEGPIGIDLYCPRATPVLIDIQNLGAGAAVVQVIMKGIEIFQPLGINRCMPGFEAEVYTPLFDLYSIPAPGWHDEPFDYYFELDATALQTKTGSPMRLDGDADFFWRGIGGYEGGGGGSQYLRFIDPYGNYLSNGPVAQDNELGVPPYTRPILPEVCCPAYSILSVDQIEYANHAAQANVVLRGVKRFRD